MATNWGLASAALATIAIISIASGFIGGRRFAQKRYAGPVEDFVLANKELRPQNVVQLLLSSSFSLNGMLYQIWLGYIIGVWALVVQFVWMLSYIWLSRYIGRVREFTSLHAFLGSRFGHLTRILAAFCSIVGFTVLVGWEFNVGQSTFAGLLSTSAADPMITVLMIGTVLVSVVYTAMGGLGGDAFADTIQNVLKLSIFGMIGLLLYFGVHNASDLLALKERVLPTWSEAEKTLGVFGLITNVAFSAVWQFVDMSTWQSVIASRVSLDEKQSRRALIQGGISTFFAPGILGTALGILLASATGVTSDNVMSKVMELLPSGNPVLIFAVFAALFAAIMSMVDGVLLAAAYSFVCDIFYGRETLEELDRNDGRANRIVSFMRVVLTLVAIGGSLGVLYLTEHGLSLFNITYVLIVGQLALVGPVFVGLRRADRIGNRMALSIAIALVVGIVSVSVGLKYGLDWPLTGAGFFTMTASYLSAVGLAWTKPVGASS